MQAIKKFVSTNSRYLLLTAAAGALLAWLMLYKLGSLVGGLSLGEHMASITPVGWHGMYRDAMYLPLNFIRSVVFFIFPEHGLTLTRLPNAFFGAMTIISFSWLIWLWHGRRTALIASLLFATSAWVLHVSRLASFDVLYLWAVPTMLLLNVWLQRRPNNPFIFYGNIMFWGLLLYVPGLVWLVALNVILQRKYIARGWRHFSAWWQRMLYMLAGIIWLPLLFDNLMQSGYLRLWLGLPTQLETLPMLAKNFVAVFVHLFIRGPQYPDMWLAKVPLMDMFTLTMCIIGIIFYVLHWQAARSRMLGLFFVLGVLLVSLAGPVSLSILVPLLYVFAATGVTYLIKEWLRVFPRNPLARKAGFVLLGAAVILACTYNLRAYFIAWPHYQTTQATFRYRS